MGVSARVKRLAGEVNYEAYNYYYPSPSTVFAALVAASVGEGAELFDGVNFAKVPLCYREIKMLARWLSMLTRMGYEEREQLLALLLYGNGVEAGGRR